MHEHEHEHEHEHSHAFRAAGSPRPPLDLHWHRAAPWSVPDLARGTAPGAADATADANAPTFLLVHGVGLSHRSLSRLAAPLRQHGEVLAPDLPGHGRSPRPDRRPTIADAAAAVGDGLARRRRASGPVVAVGHSLGAQVVVELAVARPDLVDALVLVAPVVDPAAPSLGRQAWRLVRDFVVEPPRTAVMVARDVVRCGPVAYAAGVRSMLAHDTSARLDDLGQPVVVVRGAHDVVAPDRWAQEARDRSGRGHVHEVPGGGHDVVHSHGAEVASLVLELARTLTDVRRS